MQLPVLLITVITVLLEGKAMAFQIESPAFKHQEQIPQKYTCDGKDSSPPLQWSSAPAGTQSFALIMDDPDAPMGTWVHWVLYDLPFETVGAGLAGAQKGQAQGLPLQLAENVSKDEVLPNGAKQGLNDFGKIGYGGPCPPPGKPHRYFFRLYALDTRLNLPPRKKREDILEAMKGHVLAQAEWMGTCQRQ